MPVQWMQHENRGCRCPVCGADGPKTAVLTTDDIIPDSPRILLLRCSCGAAFLDDLTPPDYSAETPEMLDYYVEQGAGIDLVVAPLLRIPPASVRSCMEIGCSYPFALDFGRAVFGWNVLGVDPSPLAAKGGAALGIPIVHAYFNAQLDVGPEPFDLAICSEILEHVPDPHSLLSSIRERLSPDGLLVLSTPNVDIINEETEEGMLARALSPGFHLILYDRQSLTRVLTTAGFADVLIDESPETLRAYAACRPERIAQLLPRDPAAQHSVIRNYLGARARQMDPSSLLASGLGYRHFKECVNAGLYEEATESRNFLARVYDKRYGINFLEPSTIASATNIPFNLSCALFYAGMLEFNGSRRSDKAAEYFAASIDAAKKIRASSCPFALFDGETEGLLRQSLKHLPMALAESEPEKVIREIELLEEMDRATLPRQILDETVAQTFVRLVNAGAYAVADQMIPRVEKLIDAHLDALYCLAMLALQQGRPKQAAELFGRVVVATERGERPELQSSARYHESLSRERAAANPQRHATARLLIAERFVAPCANVSEVSLPLDVIAREPLARLLLIVIREAGGAADDRIAVLRQPHVSARDTLRLTFVPFGSSAGETFIVGALDAGNDLAGSWDAFRDVIRTNAAGRSPIVLECRAGDEGLICDERGIVVLRTKERATPAIRTAYWLDAFWCDASGIYLRGWAHAFEHRLRALRLESAGRSVRTDVFSDRPDLLTHYPDHEQVRHGGFALYLPCPPAHPATLVYETDAGEISIPLVLPEGPVPPWPSEPEAAETLSPTLRRFASLANEGGGRVLQIGSRVPWGEQAVPPRDFIRRPIIGVDIHPGCNVDLVGDAHMLSRFIRPGSLDGVISTSVLEHVQAPWVVAAEVNRVLKMGGVVYHHVPGAWPAHAQPNDFWRFSAGALRVLFGPATGFEIIEASDSARAAIIPGPDWRKQYLDMPTTPAMAMAEIVARKVAEIPAGAVAWPLTAAESEARSHQYPLEGLRPRSV